ncbi:hypothetical protein Tco_1377905, partial [Tanacetum coccineum]
IYCLAYHTVKTASTLIETNKALVKDEEAEAVDVHLYRSMIGSLIYLKGQPKLGLWYPIDSPFDLEAFSDSDYAGASLDRKSTTRGCQFPSKRLISWQCKKQTIVANSTTEAEYVAAANCCGQVLWIQNQMLDYGFNFMNTKIYIDNESTICIVKNPVFHSKTKNIEIRHHFIRDSYEKKLIQVIKIYTDHNVADLLIKAFDVSSLSGPIHLVANETVYKEWEDRMERAATTASSLEVEQDSDAQTRFETTSKQSNDPPISRVNTLRSGEDNMKLKELMAYCTKLLDIMSKNRKRDVWICQISQEISQKRTRERMSDQEAKEIKAEAEEIMPQPSTLIKKRVRFRSFPAASSNRTPITIQPSTSKPQKKQSRRKQKKTTAVPHPSDSTADVPNEEPVPTHSNDPLLSSEDRLKLTNLMDLCTKLSERVLTLDILNCSIASRDHKFEVEVKS